MSGRALENSLLTRCQPLFAQAETLDFPLGQKILEANQPGQYVFFPLSMMASFVRQLSDGGTVEVGVVGFEGVIGISVLFGAAAQPNDVIVQIAGRAVRVSAADATKAFKAHEDFRNEVLLFANAFTTQIGQTAACNRLHALERRLARWLLMVHDRIDGDEIGLTQEFLAQMLGTRTAGVNEAISTLKRSGLIRHGRQRIAVLDRAGLEDEACECYEAVRSLYQRDGIM